MRFLSVCSGIEAASVAWRPLGWSAVAFSEIEPFPCAVLAHHYPDVPNWGDMTKYKEWPDADVDLLCGGTPCQSFSIAGLRKGLDDPRGNLMLTFGAIAGRYRPRWLVWENVPGVLSSNGGRDFGAFLGMLGELGYGVAYRVLDAQYFGVAQRRRRVFVVGYLGDWRRAAAVLFERHGLSGDPAPSREARKDVAPTLSARTRGGGGLGTDFDCDGGLIPQAFGGNNQSGPIDVSTALNACASASASGRMDFESESFVVANTLLGKPNCSHAADQETYITHTLRGEGFDASEDGTGRGTPLVPVAFDTTQITSRENGSNPEPGDPCHPLTAGAHAPAIAFDSRQDPVSDEHLFGALGSSSPQAQAIAIRTANTSSNGHGIQPELAYTLDRAQGQAVAHSNSHSNGGGHQAVSYAIQAGALRENPNSGPDGVGVQADKAYTLEARAEVQAVSVALRGRSGGATAELGSDISHALRSSAGGGDKPHVLAAMSVRRLTPEECEALQAFPRGYTRIPWRNKPADQCPDGPRYKALGNSWCTAVARWIGERIEQVELLEDA